MFYINLSSNEYSTPGYLKMGWEPVELKKPIYNSTIFGFLANYISLPKILSVPCETFLFQDCNLQSIKFI